MWDKKLTAVIAEWEGPLIPIEKAEGPLIPIVIIRLHFHFNSRNFQYVISHHDNQRDLYIKYWHWSRYPIISPGTLPEL